MTVAARFPKRTQYHCDICGRNGFWNEQGFDWTRYTSILHDDLCPDDVPTACSEDCRKQMMIRIESGRFKLPKIGKGPNPKVGDRKGY